MAGVRARLLGGGALARPRTPAGCRTREALREGRLRGVQRHRPGDVAPVARRARRPDRRVLRPHVRLHHHTGGSGARLRRGDRSRGDRRPRPGRRDARPPDRRRGAPLGLPAPDEHGCGPGPTGAGRHRRRRHRRRYCGAMSTLGQDLRYSLRTLRKSPGFSAAAVGILALGIGANTALFSVVDAALLRPLPFPEPGRMMRLEEVPPPPAAVFGKAASPANYFDWRGQSHSFAALAAYRGGSLTLTGGQEPEALTAATVMGDFFSVLAIRPVLGRVFAPEEEEPGHDNVVILSQDLWQSRFGSDPQILGRGLVLDGRRRTVVGVMPSLRVAAWYPATVQVWTPLAWTAKERAVRGERIVSVIARLKPGVDRLQAQAEMDTLAGRLGRAYPEADKGWGVFVQPLHDYLTDRVRSALLLLLGAVVFVLLIACANVANLVLVRTLGRSKEMAIRGTLGASRGRLVQQLVAEALILALAGAVLGLYLAHFGVELLVGFLGNLLPPRLEVHLDFRILLFTLGVSLFAGLAAGLAPAWLFLRSDLQRALQRGLGRTDAAAGGRRTRGALVVAEVALSLVLLLGAALMIESLGVLQREDPGCDPHGVLTLVLGLPQQQYAEPRQQSAFYDRVQPGSSRWRTP